MSPTVGLVRCPECDEPIEYERDLSDKHIVVEITRGLALLTHDSERHWPTVIATGSRHLEMRCRVCHGPINRLSSKAGSPWVIVSPCGHREGADSQISLRPAEGTLTLLDSQAYSVWILRRFDTARPAG